MGGSEEQVGKSGRESRGPHFRKAKNRTFQEKMGPLNAVIKPGKQWQRRSLKGSPMPLKEFGGKGWKTDSEYGNKGMQVVERAWK